MNKKLTVLAVGMLIASTAVLVSAKFSKGNIGDVAASEVESLTNCEKVDHVAEDGHCVKDKFNAYFCADLVGIGFVADCVMGYK